MEIIFPAKIAGEVTSMLISLAAAVIYNSEQSSWSSEVFHSSFKPSLLAFATAYHPSYISSFSGIEKVET